MPIELYFSNQLDQLADKFAEVAAAETRSRANFLEPCVVIVPNANLTKWLQLYLAGRRTIVMNIAFEYLEAGLWEMLAALDTRHDSDPPQRLDTDGLKILLLHTLQRLDPRDAAFAPLTGYLFAAGGAARPDAAARLWQLSEKLATLFEEYEFHRTDMVQRWAATPDNAAAPGMEGCQQRLYARLQRLRARMAETGHTPLLSTMEYADRVLGPARIADGVVRSPGAAVRDIHFFGLSQISNFHLTLIGRLQAFYTIHIYTMNPCEEFWEDIRTPGERRWLRRRNAAALAIREEEHDRGELLRPSDNALLAAWGKPGRESVRLLCRLTDYDFNACFAEARPAPGVLQRIQNDILTLSANGDIGRLAQDRTMQIVACPGRYREVETVYQSILDNLSRDSGLQLTDIAILVPDMSAYKPVLDSVFNRRPRQLAYNLVDSHAEIESVYGRGVLAILTLAGGRFSRSEVFDLILNPCFMQRAGIGPDDVRAWVNWTRDLNIFHAFDSRQRTARGYPAGERFTWQQGLQRLRLARIMAAPEETDPAGFAHYRGRVPYADMQSSDPELLEGFCRIIETLHDEVTHLNSDCEAGRIRRDGQGWQERFLGACDRLLEIPADRRGEEGVRLALVKAFDRLTLYDRLPADDTADTPQIDPDIGPDIGPIADSNAASNTDSKTAANIHLDIDLIREYVRANLGAVSGGHGNYLTGGVTISALQPMRPIPFRIVYVLGMEEGRFPGKANPSALDLRLARRRIGDISLPERNSYLFLEMLLSVRDKLYLSYVARDLQRDRLQQPCSVLNQLRRYAEEHVLPPGSAFRVMEVPLAGADGRYLAPDARTSWSDVLVNHSLADRVIHFRGRGWWDRFLEQATAAEQERTAAFDPDLDMTAAPAADPDRAVETITLSQLERFLKNPVRAKIQRHLGLYDEEETIEDVVLREDEPFFSEFPLDYTLKMTALRRWLDAGLSPGRETGGPAAGPAALAVDPGTLFEQVYDAARRTQPIPEGAFGDIDRRRLREQFLAMTATLTPVVAQMMDQMVQSREWLRTVIIGEPADAAADAAADAGAAPAVKRFPPLTLTVHTRDRNGQPATRTVALHGQWPWIWRDVDGWHMLVLTGSSRRSPREPDKYVLGPVLFYLLCLAGGESGAWIGSSAITLHTAYREHLAEWTYAVDRETAAAYLEELAAHLLDSSQTAWLPFETVTSRRRSVRPHRMTEADYAAADELVREHYALELAECFGEEEDYLIHLVKPIIPSDAFDRVYRRFGIFAARE